MILTLEEAANENTALYNIVGDNGRNTIERALNESFRAGAAWQKEQSIKWISITEKFPIPPPRTCLIEVLVTNGRLWERRTYNDDAKIFGNGFLITHWAYINLPKTDRP